MPGQEFEELILLKGNVTEPPNNSGETSVGWWVRTSVKDLMEEVRLALLDPEDTKKLELAKAALESVYNTHRDLHDYTFLLHEAGVTLLQSGSYDIATGLFEQAFTEENPYIENAAAYARSYINACSNVWNEEDAKGDTEKAQAFIWLGRRKHVLAEAVRSVRHFRTQVNNLDYLNRDDLKITDEKGFQILKIAQIAKPH